MSDKTISHEKLQAALGFEPHPTQKKIIESKARLKVICAGRRGGKTVVAGYEATKTLLEKNKRIWAVAPDFSLTLIVFDEVIKNLVELFGDTGFKYSKRPHPVIEVPSTGSIMEGKSVENPRGMLGRSTDLVIMDEAATVDREIWKQYLEPTTIERKGRAIMISTPRGMNWFYDIWLWAQQDSKSASFKFTSLDNPYFPKDEWGRLKEQTPERIFQQEYQAEFISDSSAVFRNLDKVIGDGEQPPKEGHSYVIGVDLAKSEDFTVLVVMDRASREMVYMDRFNDISYNIQKDRIIALSRKYNNAKVVIDSSGKGDPIAEDISRVIFTESYSMHAMKAKQQLIEKLVLFIEQEHIKILPNEILLNELRRYGYEMSSQGMKYHAPKGSHDDGVVALALAVWSLQPKNIEQNKSKIIKRFNTYV